MKKCLFRSTRWRIVPLSICVICAKIAQFAKHFQKRWRIVPLSICNLCKLHNLQKLFSFEICKTKKCLFRSTRWRIVPLSICVICANCTICKSCFQFECNLQNEEMSFQIYSLEDRTLINLCNLCKLHNLQKLFSIWVQSAKRRNVFSDLLVGDRTLINLRNLCILHKLFSIWVEFAKQCLFRSRWRIVPLSICVICANCTICKSCFQFECNLQNEEMSFQIYSLEDRTLINLCNLCKLHNLQKLFSIWVQSAKWRNVFSDLLVGGSYPYQFV